MRKNSMHDNVSMTLSLESQKGEMTCLGIIELQEESWLRHRQLGLKDWGNCSTQLLVHIRAQATNGDQLTISIWLLSPSKRYGNWSLQHNHDILHIEKHRVYTMVQAINQECEQLKSCKKPTKGRKYNTQYTNITIVIPIHWNTSSIRTKLRTQWVRCWAST